MQPKLRAVALAVVMTALMAFPVGATATSSNNSAACNQLAGENTAGSGGGDVYKGAPKTPSVMKESGGQCSQTNTSTVEQSSTATGGNGGEANGGNSGPSQATGKHAQASSQGATAEANGGNASSSNHNKGQQSNQISGRDSSTGSGGGGGENNSDICKQLAGGNTEGDGQCEQTNTSTVKQSST